jgi:tagatose 1,6-diphosphate aldolase
MFGRFRFLNPFPLVDGDLELVPPSLAYVDALLAMLRHPLTEQHEPEMAALSRGQIVDFINLAPNGRQPPDLLLGWVPSYQFWMLWHDGTAGPRVAGTVTLRVGNSADIVRHLGHVGYHVYPPARGHRFAARATRLILPLARQHAIDPLWITCNPDNLASRRTIERTGGQFVETVALPPDHLLRQRGETEKCRYRIDLRDTI